MGNLRGGLSGMLFSNKSYNLADELQKARQAAAAGKKVILFIGRGSSQGVADADANTHYCFLTPLRENFTLTPNHSSFSELMTTLLKLPQELCQNLFDEIIIDGGTINHLMHDFHDNLDKDIQLAATFLAAEISDGQLYDTKKIAKLPSHLIYQFESHSLIYHEFLLRMLAKISRNELNLTMPFGNDAPWTIEHARKMAALITARTQIDDAAVLCWYLMSRKNSALKIENNGPHNTLLPGDAKMPDRHNAGAMMFAGYVGHFQVEGLLLDAKKTAADDHTAASKKPR
jgi:hypothetical protein